MLPRGSPGWADLTTWWGHAYDMAYGPGPAGQRHTEVGLAVWAWSGWGPIQAAYKRSFRYGPRISRPSPDRDGPDHDRGGHDRLERPSSPQAPGLSGPDLAGTDQNA